MSFGAIAIGTATVGAIVNASNAAKNRKMAEQQYQETKEQRQIQQQALEVQKAEYKRMEFKNPFSNMENVYEDLTVNQQQARFQQQQAAQGRANIMQSLKEAAGASGITGLAQTLANQGALQTQRISASIGLQESQNQLAAAKGAMAIQTAERQGDQWVAQQQADRQATLLGMQMGQATGANQAAMQAQANQINAAIASQQATADIFSTAASSFAGAYKK